MCSSGKNRPRAKLNDNGKNLSTFARNLREPAVDDLKMRQVAANIWIRVVKRQSCCGHPGQPGC